MEKKEWNILIIEENLQDLRIVKEYLKRTRLRNLSIKHTDDLMTAREMEALETFDVVLLDLSLRESFAITTVQLLEPKKLTAPVIVVTALLDEETALQALTLGVQDYVVKGEFDEKLLEKTIRYAVERKKAQQLQRHSVEKYKVLFESNPVPMWAYEIHTDKIITVNEAAIKSYGYCREEFQAMPYQALFPHAGERIRLDKQQITQRQITRHKKKDGEIIDVEISTRPFLFYGLNTQLVVAYDITERKKAETDLRLFESIVINSNDAVLVTDAIPEKKGGIKINYVNEAFERMTGYSRDEILGKSPVILKGERTDRLVLKQIKDALNNLMPLDGEIINYRKDGSEYWISFSLFTVNDNYGKPSNYVSVQREITGKKELEESIRKKLEKKVAERTRELQKALSKEKELVELKNRFVTTASHEFRTPLSIISFTRDYLQQNYHKINEEEVQTKLQKIKKQVDHMTVLLEDVILAGRTELKKIPVTKTTIDLKSWTEKMVEELIQSTGKSHSIELEWHGQPGIIETDHNLLRKIMNNLLVNAIKFSPHTRKVWLSIERTADVLIVIVKDKGIGISLSDQERLFEAFHRGANATAIQGTGLGLSIVKKAVELLGGYIAISSEENEGTIITFELPL